MADPDSVPARVYNAYRQLLVVRREHPAFHPNGVQRILDLGSAVFTLMRTAPDESETLICLHNVTGETQEIALPQDATVRPLWGILTDRIYDQGTVTLAPYQILWLLSEA